MDDFMEIGETGLVPQKDGWFYNAATGEFIDPDGNIFTDDGDVIDAFEEELYGRDFEDE